VLEPAGTSAESTTALDLGELAPGTRVVFAVHAVGDAAENTGGAITVTASETSNGQFTALTHDVVGALPEADAAATALVALRPDPTRPFVKLNVTGADADADMTVTVLTL